MESQPNESMEDLKSLNTLAGLKMKKMVYSEAVELYLKSLQTKTDQANIHFNLGLAYGHLQQTQQAIDSYRNAIRYKSDYYKAYNNLGQLLKNQGQIEEGLACYEMAIQYKPDYTEAYNNQGNALLLMDRHSEALISFKKALELQPDSAMAYNNLGKAYKDLMRFHEALNCYDRAILFKPDYVSAYMNKALLCLLLGDFEQGWRLFEWRWKTNLKRQSKFFNKPLWLGRHSIQNKRILIWGEQGFGDSIQYCRYLILLEQAGAILHLRVQSSLQTLLSSLPCQIQSISTFSDPFPEFDYHCPMMSLPLATETSDLANVPVYPRYLQVEASKKRFWSERLNIQNQPLLRIGIAWSGSPTHNNDRHRSLPFSCLLPLFDLPIEFHVIQKDIRPEDLQFINSIDHLYLHSEALADFSDTAALIDAMDLVISVDTSVAHLTGALNKPLWVLLPLVPDHRWLLNRADSPWYPSARLFRQSSRGDWGTVIQQVIAAIKETVLIDLHSPSR